MSAFPSPVTVVIPRAAGLGRDFQSERHEVLLRAVWNKLECGLERLLGWQGAKVREESKATAAGFGSQLESVASVLSSLAGRCAEPGMEAWLLETRDRVDSSTVCEQIAAWPSNIAAVEIVRRELAKELTEERNARTSRAYNEVVGYVDLAADVLVPLKLCLKGNIPSWLIRDDVEQQQPWRDPLKLIRQDGAKLQELRSLSPTPPTWGCKKDMRRVWVDVRVHAVPLGQMLREVKVLQALGDHKVQLVLVLPTIDKEMEAMLANERVLATTHDWWASL
jgi:hypothetical protein